MRVYRRVKRSKRGDICYLINKPVCLISFLGVLPKGVFAPYSESLLRSKATAGVYFKVISDSIFRHKNWTKTWCPRSSKRCKEFESDNCLFKCGSSKFCAKVNWPWPIYLWLSRKMALLQPCAMHEKMHPIISLLMWYWSGFAWILKEKTILLCCMIKQVHDLHQLIALKPVLTAQN